MSEITQLVADQEQQAIKEFIAIAKKFRSEGDAVAISETFEKLLLSAQESGATWNGTELTNIVFDVQRMTVLAFQLEKVLDKFQSAEALRQASSN